MFGIALTNIGVTSTTAVDLASSRTTDLETACFSSATVSTDTEHFGTPPLAWDLIVSTHALIAAASSHISTYDVLVVDHPLTVKPVAGRLICGDHIGVKSPNFEP